MCVCFWFHLASSRRKPACPACRTRLWRLPGCQGALRSSMWCLCVYAWVQLVGAASSMGSMPDSLTTHATVNVATRTRRPAFMPRPHMPFSPTQRWLSRCAWPDALLSITSAKFMQKAPRDDQVVFVGAQLRVSLHNALLGCLRLRGLSWGWVAPAPCFIMCLCFATNRLLPLAVAPLREGAPQKQTASQQIPFMKRKPF